MVRHEASQSSSIVSVETAQMYRQRGWSVIPVVLQKDKQGKISKRPAIKWQEYQKRRPSKDIVAQWFRETSYSGIGLVTGEISGIVVVDIEHDAKPEDVEGISSPVESQTISGGRHVFYRWTKHISNAVRIGGKAIDIRGDGGFVVLPPSHLGHQRYSWLKQGWANDLPSLPETVISLLGEAQSNHKIDHTNKSQSEVHRQAAGQLNSEHQETDLPVAHEGERNTTAAKVSGMLCANMSPKLWKTAGWTTLQAWNTSKCIPPLKATELRSVWRSITASQLRNRMRQSESLTDDGVAMPTKPISILPWGEFRQQQFAEPEWIVEELVPEKGLVAVAGPPESCKSYFTTYLGIAVARGVALFDQFSVKQVGVMLVDQENLPAWIQHRLLQFQAEDQLPLYIYANRDAPFNLENKDAFSQVVAYVKKHQIGLLVLDTLRLSHTRDENSSTDMKPVFDRLKKLTKYTTVIFIQHHRKGDRKQPHSVHGEDMMGSILIRGSVDYQLSIVKLSDVSEGMTKIKVAQTKARYTKNLKPFTLTLEEQDEQLHFAYSGPVGEVLSKREKAALIIRELLGSEPLQRQEILDYLVSSSVCSKRTAEASLSALSASGEISHTNTKPRVYSLAGEQLTVAQGENDIPQATELVSSVKKDSAKPSQTILPQKHYFEPENQFPHSAGRYIGMRIAESEYPRDIVAALRNHKLQQSISEIQQWLRQHEKVHNPNFDAMAWFGQLEVYQLVVDEAQTRGIVQDEDWLEMARMTFHTNDGVTGQWLN